MSRLSTKLALRLIPMSFLRSPPLRSLGGWRAGLAAAGLGALSALALPPFHLLPVLLLCVPALLVVLDAAPNWRMAAWRGFLFGFGHHLVGLYWVTEAILVESARYWWLVPFAVPGLAALMAPFIALPCVAARWAEPGWRRVLLFAGVWTLADLLRQFAGTGFPWNPWGSVWAIPGIAGDAMLQPAAWIGTPGLTLLTVGLAALPVLGWRAASVGAGVLAVWAGFGALRLDRHPEAATDVTVVLVQGNVAQGQKWDRGIANSIFSRYLRLTRDAVAAAPADGKLVVVWPETASVYLLQSDANARAAIVEAAGRADAALVGGITFPLDRFTSLDDPSNLPRNSLVALERGSKIGAIYDKWHLVPFGEYAPTWVPFSVKLVPGNLGFGAGPQTITLPSLPPFGALICYEAIFPGQVANEADRPAWLVNITNDAWFGNSTGPRQHLAAVRMRAVEEGLPVMRAANTGISAGFDAMGREGGRLGLDVAGTLTLRLPVSVPPTPFARWGLVVPGLIALMTCALGLGFSRKRPLHLTTSSQLWRKLR